VQRCKFRWLHPVTTANPPRFDIAASPRCDCYTRLCQRFKPMFVQALVLKLALKAFAVSFLRWHAWLKQ
jgi:NADH:ubiquinone oxidoreductase subunit D